MKTERLVLALSMIVWITGCSTTPSDEGNAKAADTGYFLSWEQKGQLIGSGRIKDAEGNWYDVWVVPGYDEPAQETMTYLGKTGTAFGEYFGSKKYHDLGDASWDALTWGFDDCLDDFIFEGLPEAWSRYWSTAETRTSKRVFGWWFAYPWALLESVVDPVVRVPAGLCGTALGTAAGVAVVPSYYAVNSAVEGTWYLTMDAILLPTVACTWNTVIAPPMALVGQKPAPSRTDGFWVKQVATEEELQRTKAVDEPITPEDIKALAAYSHLLLKTVPPFDQQRQEIQRKAQAERAAISKKEQEETQALNKKMTEAIEALRADPAQKGLLDYLRERNFNPQRTSKAMTDLRQHLKTELSDEELNQLIQLLHRYAPSTTPKKAPLRPKTDPVKHSVEVIQEIK
jgi:tRNA C32,U32 (ribose-2'-O)-methylase TrmJ